MARKHEEQQPLTAGAANLSETAASSAPHGAAAVRYGAQDATAAAAGPGRGAAGAAETATNGASNGLYNMYAEEEEVETGYGGLLSGDQSNGSRASTCGMNGGAACARKGPLAPSDEMSVCDHPRMGLLPAMTSNGEPHLTRVTSGRELYGGCCRFELTFRGRSPKFIRFGVLLLITLLPFGAHFMKSCFSSLETYFLEDEDLHFNETKYGAVMSAIMIPNLFMPFFGGLILDSKGHKTGIILFLALELIGHVFFTLAMGCNSFWMAVAGEALHGLGSGTVAVAMRSIVSQFFVDNELTFALGVTVSGACVSKALAKASVAPIAETKWGYMGALWYVGLWQLLSLAAGLVYVRCVGMEREHKVLRIRSLPEAMKRSTVAFWCVAVLHTVLIMAYHLFANYSGHFLFENYHISAVLAGYISALTPLVVVFFAPIAGLILDRWGGQLYVLLAAIVVTIVGYVMLLQNQVGAVVCILLLAFCESFVPTILLSALPQTVHPSVYGAAFGMAEVLSAVATIAANIFFGYSKDKTSSYDDDIAFLVGLCFVGLALTLFLLFWDKRHGEPVLNRTKRGLAPADATSARTKAPPLCSSANGDCNTAIA